jgi:protease IV
MALLDADTLLDRMQLKQQLLRWRSLSVILITLLALVLIHRNFTFTEFSEPDFIARITIEGIIVSDEFRNALLDDIYDNDSIKAVLVYVDSPGGTAIGGEELYLDLKRIREKKPVVVLMRSIAASAGYMTALGGSHILAREGTLTGSVGVIMQSFEATELAKRMGIEPIIVKSGDFKAEPNPLSKLRASERQMLEKVVMSFYDFFIGIVTSERDFTPEQLRDITDGRVFTGRQAVEYNLIDGLGGEREALVWLQENHKISDKMRIRTLKPNRPRRNVFDTLGTLAGKAMETAENLTLTLDGLVLVWQPNSL